jgi:hypothetical protein
LAVVRHAQAQRTSDCGGAARLPEQGPARALAARSAKRIGWRTQKARYQDLVGAVNDLYATGYRLDDVHNLRPRHAAALVRLWESPG